MREGKVGAVGTSSVLTKQALWWVYAETRYILDSCIAENHGREAGRAYESWYELCEVVFVKCLDRVSTDQKESIFFVLLHVIPPTICDATVPEASAMLP